MQGTMPGARRRGRPRTAWMDNIKTWTGPRPSMVVTGLPVEESIRVTENRDKWRGQFSDRGRLKNRTFARALNYTAVRTHTPV